MLSRALGWIRSKQLTAFNKSDLYHAMKTKAYSEASDWEPVIDRMVEAGWIREAPPEKGKPGRPPERYEVHPHLLTPPDQNTQNTQNLEGAHEGFGGFGGFGQGGPADDPGAAEGLEKGRKSKKVIEMEVTNDEAHP